MAATFRCSIVTPTEAVLAADATYATFQAWDGQKGVMRGASAFLTKLAVGTVRVDLASGGSKTFVTDAGFAKMQDNELTILSDRAEEAGATDRSTAERELEEARQKVLEPGHTTAKERDEVERARELAATKVRLAKN